MRPAFCRGNRTRGRFLRLYGRGRRLIAVLGVNRDRRVAKGRRLIREDVAFDYARPCSASTPELPPLAPGGQGVRDDAHGHLRALRRTEVPAPEEAPERGDRDLGVEALRVSCVSKV